MKTSRVISTLLIGLLILSASRMVAGARFNHTYTIVAATPINLATGTSTAPDGSERTRVKKLFIQAAHGSGAGIVFVMAGIRIGRTPAASGADLTAELAPASSTAPGGSYYDSDDSPSGGILLASVWVDGAHSGDLVIVSYETSN